jgi:uncharacterized protein YjiS (DUF1127 family)
MATQIVRGASVMDGATNPEATEGPFARLVAAWHGFWRYHRTRRELETLSARELADIGLARSDIEHIARRGAREAF